MDFTDFGCARQGDEALLSVVCRDASRTPSAPDTWPSVSLYDDDGVLVARELMPPLDRHRAVGHFALPVFLGSDYAAGHYLVAFNYEISNVAYLETGHLEVIPGGHERGAVASMYGYERPHARFIVYQADDGTRVLGRNPSV